MEKCLFLLTLLLFPTALHAQFMSDQDARDQMKYDVQYLASDLLEGRGSGTAGERLAGDYIAGKFGSIGLMPYGDSATYFQTFDFAGEPRMGDGGMCQLGRTKLKDDKYHPLAFSATGHVLSKVMRCGYGIQAPELKNDDYSGKDPTGRCVALSIGSPDGIHPHSEYLAYHDLRARALKAEELGAVAVIFYNDDPTVEDPVLNFDTRSSPVNIPVVFLKGDAHKTLLLENNPVVLTVDIERPRMKARNLVGMLDNGQKNIVVIGAHYDHLGFGGEGSLHRGEPEIHNGADDNASGVAVMLQLARDLAESDHTRANDYLFIAFSGEEKGLFGSNYWTKHPTVPLEDLNYMINLDMVGRLDTSSTIGINGVGTSPAWEEVQRTMVEGLKAKTTESGVGPSDHTSFYLKGIPAIHYFTGSHADYHKPTDDEEKVNYHGMLRITRQIEALISSLNDDGKLEFTSTQDADTTAAPRFTVTLGVVPDYMFDGAGMRIDGVTDGKPAQAAGLQVGDVVVQLGDVPVSDMMSYMKGLSMFKKGDSTTVTVMRGDQRIEKAITF